MWGSGPRTRHRQQTLPTTNPQPEASEDTSDSEYELPELPPPMEHDHYGGSSHPTPCVSSGGLMDTMPSWDVPSVSPIWEQLHANPPLSPTTGGGVRCSIQPADPEADMEDPMIRAGAREEDFIEGDGGDKAHKEARW